MYGQSHPTRPSAAVSRLKALSVAALGATLLFAITAGSALAARSAPLSVADTASAYAAAVALSEGEPSVAIEAQGPASKIAAPSDPSTGVTIGSGEEAVRVTPLRAAAASKKVPLGNGKGLYRGADGQTSTIIDPVDTGVRMASVSTDDGHGTQTFDYALGLPAGAGAHLTQTGAVEVTRADGSALVTIAAPWARDAAGTSLPTSYSLDGATLTQTVDTRGAVFPVVADPRIENTGFLGLQGVKIWFTRSETESMYRIKTQIQTGASLAGVACSLISGPLAPICAAVVVYTVGDFSVNLEQAHSRNNCLTLEIRLLPTVGGPDWDDGDGSYCVHP